MKGSTTAAVMACGMLLAGAGAVRAERFAGVKYLGGVKGYGPRTGTLVIEDGKLRFEDRKGREVFALSLDSATSWVGTEKRTRFGRVFRNVALLPVTIPLTGGNGDPWIGGTRKDSPIVVVKAGSDSATLRLRVPFAQLQQVVDAVGLEAARAAAGRVSDDATSGAPGPGAPVSN